MAKINECAEEILAKIALPEEPAEIARKVYEFIGEERAAEFTDGYFNGSDHHKFLKATNAEFAEKSGGRFDEAEIALGTELMLAEYCRKYIYPTKTAPNGKPISDEIFFDTMSDITVWAKTYLRNHDKWGLGEIDWLECHVTAYLFKLGRLQYCPTNFGKDNYYFEGRELHRDTPCWTIHIPETGSAEPLDREHCLDSLHRAYEFTGGNEVYTTGSWLLYPAHFQFLPRTSNIVRFMELFDIISDHSSESSGDMWRIFGTRADFKHPENLPRDTSLQRAYADWYAKTRTTGEGFGVIVYDGEKIISKPQLYL